jgi:hypothetical protein
MAAIAHFRDGNENRQRRNQMAKQTREHSEHTPSSRHHASGEFDSKTLDALRNVEEIRIATTPAGTKKKHRATIWVVVVDDDVFIRSFTGPKGKWYRNVLANPEADVEFDGKAIHVRATPVKDRKTIESVSRAYLEKYRDSPYAKDMVRDEVLPTTLQLEPR